MCVQRLTHPVRKVARKVTYTTLRPATANTRLTRQCTHTVFTAHALPPHNTLSLPKAVHGRLATRNRLAPSPPVLARPPPVLEHIILDEIVGGEGDGGGDGVLDQVESSSPWYMPRTWFAG